MGLPPKRRARRRARPSPARVAALAAVVLSAGIAGCGGGGGGDEGASATGATPSGAETVTIEEFAYEPAELTVAAGTTVEFPNEDGSPHTATSEDSGAFDTGTIKPGKSGEVTLGEPGTYAYICEFHPFMKGTVTVE